MFARKARGYKLTDMFLFKGSGDEAGNNCHQKIECTTKLFKKHQSTIDADYIFITIF